MITTYNDVFDDRVKIAIGPGRNIIVTETDAAAKLKKLSLKLQKSDIEGGAKVKNSIFIELDKSNNPHEKLSYFFCSKAKHVNKRCDLVILHEKEDYLAALICDLKSSPKGCEDIRVKNQFLNSKLFVEYVSKLSKEYYLKDKEIRYFYISFYPMLSFSTSAMLGDQRPPKLKPYNIEINLESVNINEHGAAVVFWRELLSRLP